MVTALMLLLPLASWRETFAGLNDFLTVIVLVVLVLGVSSIFRMERQIDELRKMIEVDKDTGDSGESQLES